MANRYDIPTNGYDGARPLDKVPVLEVMTRDVAAVAHDDSIVHAAQLLRDKDVGALPVVDDRGRPVGMITDRDIACRLVADGDSVQSSRVHHAMTGEVFACPANASVEDCMGTMASHQIRRVMVVDQNDRLVGIVSQADLAQHAECNCGAGERRAFADVVCSVSAPGSQPYH
jgi:CBS domain-containing protein